MNKPETPSTETTTPTQDIGDIKIREEEGLTSNKPEDGSTADKELDVAGGVIAIAPISADGSVTKIQPAGILGIPTSKLMPE